MNLANVIATEPAPIIENGLQPPLGCEWFELRQVQVHAERALGKRARFNRCFFDRRPIGQHGGRSDSAGIHQPEYLAVDPLIHAQIISVNDDDQFGSRPGKNT